MGKILGDLGRETRFTWILKCWQLIELKIILSNLNKIYCEIYCLIDKELA